MLSTGKRRLHGQDLAHVCAIQSRINANKTLQRIKVGKGNTAALIVHVYEIFRIITTESYFLYKKFLIINSQLPFLTLPLK